MTTVDATEATIAEAAEALKTEMLAILRPALFRTMWRKAHASLRAYGYGDGHQEGAAKALAAAFPEYAHLIPARLNRYGEETLPPELTAVLGRPAPTIVVDLATQDDDEDEDDECDHDDHPWRCTQCGGLYSEDCDGHSMECGECGHERECPECGLEPDSSCRHNFQCEGCNEDGMG